MKHLITILALSCSGTLQAQSVIVVQGAPGASEYAATFTAQTETWLSAAQKAQLKAHSVLPTAADQLQRIEQAVKATPPDQPLWLAIHGHGTYDGRLAKFNLAGPDLEPKRLADLLSGRKADTIIIAAFSGSGAFVKPLSGSQRIIVSATKDALELSYARFGQHFATAIAGKTEADLDHDGATSVLESFLYAARTTTQFYEDEGRICTEHALIEDNLDGIGTRSESFNGIRPAQPTVDGRRAHQLSLILSPQDAKLSPAQRSQRDSLELRVQQLLDQRQQLSEVAYYQQLEVLFRQIADVTLASPQKQ